VLSAALQGGIHHASADEVQPRQRGRSLISTNLERVRGFDDVGTDRGWSQLVSYLLTDDVFPLRQSGFRAGHSTETAVLRVLSDLLHAADGGEYGVLVPLDLSAAFDTVDHAILLERIETTFGTSG
jgi:Reverse transcriptase (RNA-dependent DNA polymerase)